MANTPLSKDVPHIYVPSFSVPHLKVPKLYVPHISTPGKGSFTPAERRHVKDLGDIILGNPITGTRQLRETLEDNNAANLIGNPVMSRLAGLGYLTKERLLEPYKEKSFTAATGTAFINSLESLGYSLDTLANPIKSLMPWAGGGKSGDFLRSMGWIDDEYREQYQWDTGIFAVDLAGEILSDPLNFTKIGSKIALNTSGLYDELSMTIRNTVRNRWGDVVADRLPDSFIKQVVDELEKDVAKVDESKIIKKLKLWAEREQDINILTSASAKNTADAMRYEAEFVAPYRKVLDLKQQDEFLSDLLDIKLSNAYRQYNAIRSVGETAKMIDNQLLKISLGINPLLGGNALLYKNLSPVVKAKWSNLIMTKKQFDLATYFDNSPATVKRIQRAATMKSKAKYKNVYSKFKGMLDNKVLDINELVDQYYKILDSTPLSLRTKRGVDYEFVKWLRNKYPELRYVIDLINDPALKELIDSIKIGSTDPVSEIERLFPDLIEYVESTGPEAIVQAKQLNDVINATADIAIQHKVISDTAKQKMKKYLTEQINNFFKEKHYGITAEQYIKKLRKQIAAYEREKIELDIDRYAKLHTAKRKLVKEVNDTVEARIEATLNELKEYFIKQYNKAYAETIFDELLLAARKNDIIGTIIIDGNEYAVDVSNKLFGLKNILKNEITKNIGNEVVNIEEPFNKWLDTLKESMKQDLLDKRLDELTAQIDKEQRPLIKKLQDLKVEKELEIEQVIKDYPNLKDVMQITKERSIKDYPIIKRLEFIDQKILVDHKTGAHYGLKNLDAYRRFLKSTNPDAYQMLNEAFKMLGLDLDITTQDHPLITLYGKYIDSGKKKTHLIAEMKKYFDVNVADDRSSSNINTLKKVNLVQETNTHKRMEAFAKSKVANINNEIEKVAFDIKTNVIPTILYEEQGMNYDDAVQMFAMLDELFPYYGGSALYSGFDTTWEGSFKRLMEMSTDSIAKDPKTFYENFTNFKRNIDRMYWSLHNGTNDRALIEKIKELKQTNFNSIITELHDNLVIAQDTFMPRLIELASTGESIYKLQLTHKANISRLKLALEELFSTNSEVWNAYTDPTSPVRQNLERICNAYANKSDEALQFAKEIETVLTYLDATIAMNNLFDAIPSLTKYEMPALLNNILIDRILDVIEHYNTLKIDINTLDPKAIAKEILDEVYKVLNSKPVNKAKGRLYEQIIEEFFKLNPQYTDEFYWRIARLEPGTQISMDDYAKAYDSFKLDLGTQLETNLPKAIDQYLNSMKSLQQRNSFVTLGTIIDAQAIDNMSALGVFQADVIDALEGLNFNENDVELVKDFISNVTGRYLRSEIEEARTSALQRLDDLKSVLTADEYRAELIVATKEALEGMRMVENTLGRTVTNTWNEIARYNDELQTVMGAGGKVKSKYGVNRMKNILSYIARSEIDNILGQEQTAYNIMSWAVANGEIGLKKVVDSKFLKRHFLDPSYFRLEAGVDDRIFAQLYENYNYYFNEVLSNKFYVLPDTTLETIKENLIKFTSENNTVNRWLPANPELYFNKLDAMELVTWDQLIRTGIMENKTALGYTLANKYKAIENMDEELDTITKNLGLKQALKKGIDIPEEVWQEAVDTIGEMHLSGLEDAFLTDINKYMKDIDSMQYHKHDFESFISRQQSAFNNLKPISALSEDTRELGDIIKFEDLSKFEQQQLVSVNINKHTRVNSKEFQKYLADETAHNIAMSIRTASAKELRGYIDNYTEGLMFFVSDGRPFKWSKAQLEEAGLVIARVPESNIWIIRRTDNINRGYKFKWKMNKSLFPELREQYTDVIRKNRNYFNLQGMDVPDELITGDMLNTHTYRALLKDPTVQSLIGDETEQKLYSKLSKNGRNNFYYGDYSRINLALIGDNSNAYNAILDHFMTSLIDQGITPYFRSNRLDTIMYHGNTTAIKNVNKKTKFLQLFFNDDFSLGAPMFRRGLENATDAELKTFFDKNNFVPCILKEDRHGNPRVYKIYIENKKQLADAIKAKAIVVPYETYSTLVSTVNTSLLEDKVFQAYTKYVVGAFKTIYLTAIGFLFRNGLDSLIYKNMNSTDGIPSMVDTFRYEVEARKMLKEYNDILKEALVRGGNEFHTKALEEILSELPKNKQIEFRLTNRFINSKASSGLAETMEEYYRSKELRDGIVSNNKSFWASFNEEVIHGKYSPITIVNNANSNIEQTARYGLFLNLVHNGVDIEDALKKVIDTHFNYDLKGTNLELLEQIFWFSTFPINNFNYYINEGLTKNPELLKAQIAAIELSYNNGDITWDDVRNSNYLRYNATVGNIVIKVNGKNIVVKTGSSVFDFFNLLFNPAGEIGERVNPFLAVMLGLENVSELNPLSATYSRAKQFFQGRSLIPSLYSTLYERQQKVRFPKLAKAPTYYRKSRWNIKPRKSYFKNPDNMKRMRYRFTTYRYYFGRGKNYRRWLQSSTSIEPYWHNQNYKRLRSSRARSYKQQIKRM